MKGTLDSIYAVVIGVCVLVFVYMVAITAFAIYKQPFRNQVVRCQSLGGLPILNKQIDFERCKLK